MKIANIILNFIIVFFFGAFIGVTYLEYKWYVSDPDYFAPFSAPWYYYDPLIWFMIFIGVSVLCIAARVVIHVKSKNGK